jgi:ribosomal-protein-alanine N-acetyltransferase
MKVLDTERLVLSHLTAEDAGFMLALLNDPSFISNIGDRGVKTIDAARAYIANGPGASYERHGFGMYLVSLGDTGEKIGICGLVKRDALEDVDIGFAFFPAFWSKGYAIESATAVKAYARDVARLRRLVAVARPDNHRSIRVLEKLGFRPERPIRLSPGDDELMLFGCDLERNIQSS